MRLPLFDLVELHHKPMKQSKPECLISEQARDKVENVHFQQWHVEPRRCSRCQSRDHALATPEAP